VVIATIDDEGYPFNSYAPFIYVNNHFYTFMSNLANHTKYIQVRSQASLLFIEEESQSEHIFARKRVTLTCNVKRIPREHKTFSLVTPHFMKKHGEMAQMLMQMKDFNLYEFTPLKGSAVFGFGASYKLSTKDFNTFIT
jgi:putative heme iron utilization protein